MAVIMDRTLPSRDVQVVSVQGLLVQRVSLAIVLFGLSGNLPDVEDCPYSGRKWVSLVTLDQQARQRSVPE